VKSRKIIVILLVVILLVGYYIFGTGYLREKKERVLLISQLAEATGALALIPAPPTGLDVEVTAANTSLENVKADLPEMMSSTRVVNDILSLAEECNVKAIPLVTQSWVAENVQDYSYAVFRLNVEVTGDLSRLVDFMEKLEENKQPTLVIEEIKVNRPTDLSGESTAPVEIQVSAYLNLAIYSQLPETGRESSEQ